MHRQQTVWISIGAVHMSGVIVVGRKGTHGKSGIRNQECLHHENHFYACIRPGTWCVLRIDIIICLERLDKHLAVSHLRLVLFFPIYGSS